MIGSTGRDVKPYNDECRSGHPRVVSWLSLALLLIAVSAGGCGGCGSSGGGADPYAAWGGMSEEEWRKAHAETEAKERREQEEAKKAAEKRKAEALAKKRGAQQKPRRALPSPPPPAGSSVLPVSSPTSVVSTPSPAADLLPPLPLLPESIVDWQEGDLFIARVQGDPQLPLAIARFSKLAIGDGRAAAVLSSLLEPPTLTDWLEEAPEPRRPSRATKRSRRSEEKTPPMLLIETIAEALGENGTPKARQTLGQMIAGTIETEHDRTAALAAVRSLVDHPCPENEAMLLRLLTATSEVRPSGRGDVSAEELRTKALEWVRPRASQWLRSKVAEHIVAPSTPQSDRDLLGQLTAEWCPENLEAQAVLFQGPGITGIARRALDQQFAMYSSDAIGCILGFPAPREKTLASPDWPLRVTRQLWSDPSVERICNRLNLVGTLRDDGPLVSLASTVPYDLVRRTLCRTLEKHWEDGPRSLRTAGLSGNVLCEPGYLVVLKTIYRKESLADRSDGSKYLPPGKPENVAKLLKARQKRTEELDQDWNQLSRELAQAMCGQFRAAALARARNTGQSAGQWPVDPAAFPISLHSDQSVFAVYQLDWASGHQAVARTPMDPLKVAYIRYEEKTRPVKVQGFYRRQLKACDVHSLKDGVWLDSLVVHDESGIRRSIDVLITCVNPDAGRFADEEQKLVIEIVCVEIRDPRVEIRDPLEAATPSGRNRGN